MAYFHSFRLIQRPSVLLLAAAALLFASSVFVVSRTDVFASHTTHSNPVIYGWVVDENNNPVSNVAVKNCWNEATPQPASCAFPSQAGYTDLDGHWEYSYPATVYHHFFTASPQSTNSVALFYDISSTNNRVMVNNLVVPGSGTPTMYTLTINKNGSGNIYYSPPGNNCGFAGAAPPCTYSYAPGSSVTLAAQNDTGTGSVFTGWSGDCSGTATTCSLTMNSAKNATASFSSSSSGNVPTAPSNLRLDPAPTGTTIYLKWNDNATNEDKFNVERSPTGQNVWTTLAQLGVNTTMYTDTTAVSGSSYDYRVQACLSGYGCSSYVSLSSVSTSGGGSSGSNRFSGYVRDVNNQGVQYAAIKYCRSTTQIYSCNSASAFDTGAESIFGGSWEWDNPSTGYYYVFFATHSGQTSSQTWVSGIYNGGQGSVADLQFSTVIGNGTETTSAERIWGYVRDANFQLRDNMNVRYCASSTPLDSSSSSTTPPPCASISVGLSGVNGEPGKWILSTPGVNRYYRFWVDVSGTTYGPSDSLYPPYYTGGDAFAGYITLSSLSQATGSISGSVTRISSTGQEAVPYASVVVQQQGGTVSRFASTQTNGFYSIGDLPLGYSYTVTVTPPVNLNLAPQLKTVWLNTSSPNISLNFSFSSSTVGSGTIEGRVTDNAGQGQRAVSVQATASQQSGFRETQTDDAGFFRLTVPAGRWEISAHLGSVGTGGTISPPSRLVDVAPGATVFGIGFQVQRGDATISGRVLDKNGVLLTGVRGGVGVEASSMGGEVTGGTFTLGVPAGTYRLHLSLSPEGGYFIAGSKTVTVATGQTVSVDFLALSVADGGRIEGTLQDAAGAPVIGVEVRVDAGSGENRIGGTVDKATGRFAVSVPPGTWYLGYEVLDPSYVSGGRVGEATSISAGQVVTRTITLRRADAAVVASVRNADGTPFANVGVEVSAAPFRPEFADASPVDFRIFSETNAEGMATFAVPADTYYVRSFAPYNRVLAINPAEQSVTVATGGTGRVTLTFRQADALISGRVMLEDTPIPGAFVGGWSTTGGFSTTESSADGSFRLPVSSEDVWNIKGRSNVNGYLYSSGRVEIDMAGRTSASQDLALAQTGLRIPAPVARQHDATVPLSLALDDGARFSCAAACFTASGEVNVRMYPAVEAPDQGGVQVLGLAYDVTAFSGDGAVIRTLGNSAIVGLSYRDEDIQGFGIAENALQIASFDEDAERWMVLENSIVDAESNFVTTTTDHLTRFAIVTPASSGAGTATISEGDLIRGPDGTKVFIVNANGYKRHIFNPAVFGMYRHFTWESIKDVSQATLDSYATSDLYRADSDYKVYSLEEVDEAAGRATKRWLDVSTERFAQIGYDWSQVFIVNSQERDYYESGSAIQ